MLNNELNEEICLRNKVLKRTIYFFFSNGITKFHELFDGLKNLTGCYTHIF